MVGKLLVALIIIVIVVVAAAFLLVMRLKNNSAHSGNTSTIGSSTGVAGTTIGSSPYQTTTVSNSRPQGSSVSLNQSVQAQKINETNNGGGAGQYYMDKNETARLFGANGTYNSTGEKNGALLAQLLNSGNSIPSILDNNVTAAWEMTYTLNYSQSITPSQNGTQEEVLELVYQSQKAKLIYDSTLGTTNDFVTNSTTGTIALRNQTINGMVYSYQESSQLNTSILLGYKNDGVATIFIIGNTVNQTALVSTVASDIP